MPKLTFKKEDAPIKVPNFAEKDIRIFLDEVETEEKDSQVTDSEGKVETVKVKTPILKDGKPVFVNISANVAKEFEKAEEVRDDESNRVIAIRTKNLIAEIAVARTNVGDKEEKKVYEDEYVNLRALTGRGAQLLMDGIMDITIKTVNGEQEEVNSVCKYFNQGYGILARNAAAARIRTKVEGPDKALEAAARDLARAKGWSFEKAMAKVRLMAADD